MSEGIVSSVVNVPGGCRRSVAVLAQRRRAPPYARCMHGGGRGRLPPTRTRQGAAAGNPQPARRGWRLPHQGGAAHARPALLRGQDQCQLPAQRSAAWTADHTGHRGPVRSAHRPASRRHGFDGHHGAAHCGCDCGCGQIPGADKQQDGAHLRLRWPGAHATARAAARAQASSASTPTTRTRKRRGCSQPLSKPRPGCR